MRHRHHSAAHWHLTAGGVLGMILAVALLVLVACNDQGESISDEEMSTLVAQALPTQTPRPTFTPVPTDTPVPTAANTATAMPTPTSVPVTLTPTEMPTATPDPRISPLTGLRVSDPALLRRRVLAVRIGNDPSIRPQEGLAGAEIVYEEIMDGWAFTRFTALYLANEAERLRPIRSARLSSLNIIPQYDAVQVHTGASDTIRWLISQATETGFVDLDEYYHPKPYGVLSGYDWRGRVYTSVEKIREYLREKGLERDRRIPGYVFDGEPPPGETQPALLVHIPYPKACVAEWRYDQDAGRYLRWVQGEPHLDGLTGEQLAADNVIVFYAEHKKTDIVEDSLGNTAIDIVMTGSGRAQICRDGLAIEGRWVQSAANEPIQYYDDSGKVIPLRPGNTWIQLVPQDYDVAIGQASQ